MMRPQPSEAMEAENAAWVWAKHCLAEHLAEVRKGAESLSDSQWQEIEWTFERLKRARERHVALETARTGK